MNDQQTENINNLNFDKLLETYEATIDLAKTQRQRKNDLKGIEYWDAFIDGAWHLFQDMKVAIGFEPQVDEPTEEEKRKYGVRNNEECPIGILRYRNQEVPIYLNDYGQEEYMIFQGKGYSSGSFNVNGRKDFCCMIDDVLDRQTSK